MEILYRQRAKNKKTIHKIAIPILKFLYLMLKNKKVKIIKKTIPANQKTLFPAISIGNTEAINTPKTKKQILIKNIFDLVSFIQNSNNK